MHRDGDRHPASCFPPQKVSIAFAHATLAASLAEGKVSKVAPTAVWLPPPRGNTLPAHLSSSEALIDDPLNS